MDKAQLRIAESCDGLLEFLPKSGLYESYNFECWKINGKYKSSKLLKSMMSLGDAINTSVHTDVHISTVSVLADDLAMDVAGKRVTFPIAHDVASSLYKMLDPSLVGVENRGNVLDTTLRRSHEASIDFLRVSNRIACFDFPEEMRCIHEKLCPSAVSLRAELYRFVIYGEGDFFVPHRDSVSSADMFSSISLQLPVMQEQGKKNDAGSSYDSSKDSRGSNVKRSGQLLFYVGRRSSDVYMHETSYGDTSSAFNAEDHIAQVLDLDSLNTEVMEDGTIKMSYAAWTSDVLHEVRYVDDGYRVVLVYRLYREGCKMSYIPFHVRISLSERIAHVMSVMSSGEYTEFRHLGFTLRHTYPPAGLQPTYLKGIDAVLYIIASKMYRCLLFNAHDVWFQRLLAHHTRKRNEVTRIIFFTAGAVLEDIDFLNKDALEIMASRYKALAKTAWMKLGFGTLVGGGFCFGNADTGKDRWYRSAVMIITPEPSLWKRRRNFLLVALRASECMRRLLSNLDIAEKIVSFL